MEKHERIDGKSMLVRGVQIYPQKGVIVDFEKRKAKLNRVYGWLKVIQERLGEWGSGENNLVSVSWREVGQTWTEYNADEGELVLVWGRRKGGADEMCLGEELTSSLLESFPQLGDVGYYQSTIDEDGIFKSVWVVVKKARVDDLRVLFEVSDRIS